MKRKYIFLTIFIISIIFIFNITNAMLSEGFSESIGLMKSSDRRYALSLISIFFLFYYFIEEILEKISKSK